MEIVNLVKKGMKDLDIKAQNVAIDLILKGNFYAQYPTCCVDKHRQMIYLRLIVDVIEGHVGWIIYDKAVDRLHIFYHELMHAKDSLEGRFPSCGFTDPLEEPELFLVSAFWHFSLEGRLEKWGLPYQRRQRVLDIEYDFVSRSLPRITKDAMRRICDKLWGDEVTFPQLLLLAQALKEVV